MRKIFTLLTLFLTASLSAQVNQYVNPFIGTTGMGHCFPGACVPFGAVQLSPDTDTIPHNIDGEYQTKVYDYCAGYQYEDPTIVGFSHTHLSGTGHSDLGDILIMPQTGALRLQPGTVENPGYRQRYSHETEHAQPGYYEVTLEDGVRAQLTATQRVGVHKYTFPADSLQRLVVDLLHGIYNYDGKVLWSSLRVVNDTLVTGSRYTDGWARFNQTYFAISFSKPVVSYGYRDRKAPAYTGFWRKFDVHHNFPDIAGRDVTAYFEFAPDTPELTVKVALSAVSASGAVKNLAAEAAGSFDELRALASAQWEKELGSIACEGTDSEKRRFYTALYHTLINPSVYMDVDGQYRGVDGEVHKADGFTNYTVFSLWDTYRAEHPLLNLWKPSRNTDMVRSMLAHWKQNPVGMLPVWSLQGNEGWCMSGYHAVSVVADALVKGADIDASEALEAMVATANCPYLTSAQEYIQYGYAPFDHDGTAASNTLEYSYDDWCILQAALFAGREDIAEAFRPRAKAYRHIYHPATGFATPRYKDGSFKEPFDPLQTYGEGFIEGNSWNFSFHVPQDPADLIACMGGEKVFLQRLDQLFDMELPAKYYEDNEDITEDCLIGGYVHGNEPSHHIPYLYAWTSQPWKTQDRVRNIMNRMYRDDIRGLGGNDDCGQMSAWFVFSALGFYPVAPGSTDYVLGVPYLPYFRVTFENGRTLEIKADGVSDRRHRVKKVLLNGKPIAGRFISHEQLLEGGVLEFRLGW